MIFEIIFALTPRSWSTFIAAIATAFAIILVAKYYRIHRVIHYKYMLLAWGFMYLSLIFYGLSWSLNDNWILLQIGNAFTPMMVIAFFFLIDAISKDKFDSSKILIYFIFIMGYIASGNRWYMYTSMIYISGVWVYFHAKIRLLAPSSMHQAAWIALIGSILMAIGNMYFFFNIGDYNYLFVAIGACAISWAYRKAPNLAYLLPNEVYRLTIMHLTSGLPLFTHNWDRGHHQIDESLFSGMLSGISMLVKEAVDKGNLREITLDNAVLIIHRDPIYPVAFILLTKKLSKALRSSLNEFGKRFVAQFNDQLKEVYEVSQFNSAEQIVQQCFSFLSEE